MCMACVMTLAAKSALTRRDAGFTPEKQKRRPEGRRFVFRMGRNYFCGSGETIITI